MTRLGQILLFSVLFSCATTKATQDTPVVKTLAIEGASKLPASKIEERILTAETSSLPDWVPFLGEVRTFDATVWQADLRRIERYYQANGYYQARIVEEVVDDSKPGVVRLKVKIEEGQPTRIRSFVFDGLDALPAKMRTELLSDFPLKLGDIFLEDNWVGLKPRLEARLREWGYAQAQVKGEVTVDVEKLEASVLLAAKLGIRYKFGPVFITNNEKVPTKYLKEVVEAEIRPGSWYSESYYTTIDPVVF